ncbi:MAG: hypothetical protein ACI3Z0_11280 [Candidatus Cryptobacteroides sp.]
MKHYIKTLAVLAAAVAFQWGLNAKTETADISPKVKVGGYIGSRIDLCTSGMIMKEDVDALVETGYPVDGKVRLIHFCDFASAGNDWNPCGRYRVWIPRTLHVMSEPYHRY